jgi:hypothetical protein
VILHVDLATCLPYKKSPHKKLTVDSTLFRVKNSSLEALVTHTLRVVGVMYADAVSQTPQYTHALL